MIRLVYFSTANADIKRADVEKIAHDSADANLRRGVTGAVAYNGRNFCQCLEGNEAAVRALVDTISKDTRHSGFKIIDEKQVGDRHFAAWGMQLVDGLDFSAVINAMRN